MCKKHEHRCAALQEIREEALAEWTEAVTQHAV
jgi:hypothetical protein